MATFELRAGDTNTSLEVQLTRRDGTLQPLNGTETGSFIFSDWRGNDIITKALAISDQVDSKVRCTLASTDTNTRKGQTLRVRIPVTFGGGAVETFPTSPDDLLAVIT